MLTVPPSFIDPRCSERRTNTRKQYVQGTSRSTNQLTLIGKTSHSLSTMIPRDPLIPHVILEIYAHRCAVQQWKIVY